MLGEPEIQELRSALRGNVMGPSDQGYEEARRLYNAMIDKRPALIGQCTVSSSLSAAAATTVAGWVAAMAG
ncbi:hypothetical protein [Virgifigura deserti]|uniref:hypothetical protein n=1 Tax=Virgifigura deserti TaxID=2268457 RepID=UPI003CCBEA41